MGKEKSNLLRSAENWKFRLVVQMRKTDISNIEKRKNHDIAWAINRLILF